MSTLSKLMHGGGLNAAISQSTIEKSQWLDLSTGINPSSVPLQQIPSSVWQRLPEDDDGLLQAAQNYYGSDSLLMTPGSQWSIRRIAQWRRQALGSHSNIVLLPELGYREHFLAWQDAGFDCHFYRDIPTQNQLQSCAAAVVINPNNPSGCLIKKDQLLNIHRQLQSINAWLIVDEAFIDITPEQSLAENAGVEGLIVLRSLGKFFGLAGCRVGSLFAWPQLLSQATEDMDLWSIANPSRWAAKQAFQNHDWQQAERQSLPQQSQRLENILQKFFKTPVSGCALFKAVWLENSESIYFQLLQNGIFVRLLHEYKQPGLRFGLPDNTEDNWQRLTAALKVITE